MSESAQWLDLLLRAAAEQARSRPSMDDLRCASLIVEEMQRIRVLLLELFVAPLQATVPATPPVDGEEESYQKGVELLRGAQLLLLRHPIAAQAAFSALVAEGRRFAETPEGEHWKSALASSELITRLRLVWEAMSLNLLEESPATVLPSAFVEVLFSAARSPAMAEALRGLQLGPAGGGR